MRNSVAQMSMLFGNRLKIFVPSWSLYNAASLDTKVLVVSSVFFSMVIAAWTFGIHALQGQQLSLIYSLAIGLSISISYAISIFFVSRRISRSKSYWKTIIIDFLVFGLSSALLLSITLTIARYLAPYGMPSPLWPGLFIRQAPISLIIFVGYHALAQAAGSKPKFKPRSAELCLSLSDATLLEAQGNYVRVTTPSGSRLIRMTLAMAEQSLPQEHFCRIHRSRIVRRDQIESVDWLEATVRLVTGETVKSSSTGLANLRAFLS